MNSPWFIALVHPLNLLILGISVLSGLLSAWWLFPLGLIFWLIMFLSIAKDPTLQLQDRMQKRATLPQRFQQRFTRIEKVEIRLMNAANSSPANNSRLYKPIQEKLTEVVNEIHQLCQRVSLLENYLITSPSPLNLEAEMNEVRKKIQNSTSPQVAQEYQETLISLESRLANIVSISNKLTRFDAQLESTANQLDVALADILRLQTLEHDQAEKEASKIVARISSEQQKFIEFQNGK